MRKGSHQTEQANQKNRLAHLGKILTYEQRKNVIEANRRINASIEVRQKKHQSCVAFYESSEGIALKEKWSKERERNQHARGYRHTEDTKRRMSLHHLGQQNMLGHRQSDEAKAKVSKATKGSSNPMYGKTHSPEIRAKLSEICKKRWHNWTDEEKHKKLVQLGQHIYPTRPELKIMVMLDMLYPNEWRWVGNRVSVGLSKPDIININGKNLLILEHGIYWHLWKPQKEHPELGLTKETVETRDIAFYKSYGWETLIIWDDELKQPDKVKAKIRDFVDSY